MADVVVVGGGIIGLAAAFELQRRGLETMVLERATCGSEASSVAGGMLCPQIEAASADADFRLGLLSREMYGSWVSSIEALSQLKVGYHVDGALQLAEGDEALEAAWSKSKWQLDMGLRVERLDRAGLGALVPDPGPGFSGAIHYADEAQVDPARLVRALWIALKASGAAIVTKSPVRRLLIQDGRIVGLDLEDERMPVKKVVLAAGPWSGHIEGSPLPDGVLRPVRGQILTLDAGQPPCRPYLIMKGTGYVVPRRDGRVVVGATSEHAGFIKSTTAEGIRSLLDAALRMLPGLAPAPILETQVGLRPWTTDHLPVIGPAPGIEGLYLATGHFRNGILQAPATSRLIADLILGKRPDVDTTPFRVDRFPPPGSRPKEDEEGEGEKS